MQISGLPFGLIFMAALIPMVSSIIGGNWYHLPAIIAVVVVFLILMSDVKNLRVLFEKRLSCALFIMIILLAFQVVTGRGFVILAAGGYLLMFALFFYNLLLTGNVSITKIARELSFIYKFVIGGLIIETLLIFLGLQPLLVDIINSPGGTGYKNNNPADALRMIGLFQDAGGLNSIFLGSQIAGMLSLFAVIWFSLLKKCNWEQRVTSNPNLWVYLSFIMLLITLNGMTLIMTILSVIINRLFIEKVHAVKTLILMSLTFLALCSLVFQGYLLDRIFSSEVAVLNPNMLASYGLTQELYAISTFDYYIFMFINPLDVWLLEGEVSKLFGVGTQPFLDSKVFISGDFGFATDVLLKSGLLWSVVFLATVLSICLPALKVKLNGSNEQQLLSRLGSVNALISLLWLFSSGHYNQAMQNPGCQMFFALQLALVMYCSRRARGLLSNQLLSRNITN